ncbi:type II toxin-antitoxin system RelE/ParE family toxin [Flavobacterium sp.]|jgi:hypothetical protein|uniref:type II toxin-antitoxin system RelE/ParE family toxin n=1 Tax=Flavobacterium sp. TaxID=239 RepID=UPI0037BFE1C7
MKFEFVETSIFEKELKRLSKKHKSIKEDIRNLMNTIEENPDIGVDLGNGFKKIRMSITSKGKGKSGGARVVTQNIIINKEEHKIIMVILWDKSEVENVDIKILKDLI